MSRAHSGQTARLSDFIQGKEFADIPAEVIHRAKACLLDWIGSAVAGIGCPSARIVAQLIGEAGGKPAATMIASTQAAPPVAAALYNGTVSAVMEIDDVHEEASLHTGIAVIPAALATAEYAGASGKDLLAAIVLGYDISVRVARAAGPTHYHFWHTSGTCNTFGAAAAAAKLLRLDSRGIRMALGLAGTQAAGLWESLNDAATMAKHLHSGKAASNGILAALLARGGYEGSGTILEGDKGFLAAASKATEEDLARLTEGLGEPFLIMKNFFKRHACCRAAFEGIEGVGQLLASHTLRPEDVEKITVTMRPSRNWLVAKTDPADIYQAKFSLPFCMAAKALHGDAGLFQFREENLHDPAIRAFMSKITLVDDPALAVKARIELIDTGGRPWSVEPVCRSLSEEEVTEKFIRNTEPFLDETRMHEILSAIDRLDGVGQIAELTRLLVTPLSRRVSA